MGRNEEFSATHVGFAVTNIIEDDKEVNGWVNLIRARRDGCVGCTSL